MSNNLDLSNITALTNQINTLKQQAAATNTGANAGNETEINNTLLSLQQNFSQMLNDLVSVSN
ncbi:MAG TPA: hypothetical protein VMT55_00840, partial [Candidatus Sulfotelmatobacter sp.]|nr:hypothetical protein [Candidatus Sulfotelmatobacter sp.]